MVNLIETRPEDPKIVTERRGGVTVGRLVIPTASLTRWEPSETFLGLFNALNGQTIGKLSEQEELRRSLLFGLNNNTPNNHSLLRHERPVSAYFTYNPRKEEVIIEWGTVDPRKRVAKLHTYLNQVVDYATRVKQGMKLSSGHIARVSSIEEEVYFALLDNVASSDIPISRNDPMGRLINTLHFSGFIPLAADGLIKIPAF